MTAPILWAAAAVAAGIGVADSLALSRTPWGLLAVLALFGLGRTLARRRGTFVLSLAVLFALGGFAVRGVEPPPPAGGVCDEPAPLWRAVVDGPISRVPDPTAAGIDEQVDLRLDSVRCDGVWQRRAGRVRITLRPGVSVVRGDVVALRLATRPLTAARNPTDVDPELVGRRLRRSDQAQVRSPHVLIEPGTGPWALLDRARNAAARRFEAALAPVPAALAKALAMGDQSAIDLSRRDAWARAGTAHLLSVSGLHIALVALLVFYLLRGIMSVVPGAAERFSSRRLAAACTVPVVALYTVFVGAPACAVRSAVMAAMYFIGIAIGRPSTAKNGLGVAGLAILLFDPMSLYDPGFVLSMAAVAALLVLPRLKPATTASARAWRIVMASLITSVAATLATAPITAAYFGQTSLIAPLTNLVAVPLGSAVATPLALLFLALAPLWSGAQTVLAAGLDLVLSALDGIARYAALLPGAALDLPRPTFLEIAAYYGLMGSIALGLHRHRHRPMLNTVLVAVLALSCCGRLWSRFARDELVVVFPYVGQAETTVVELPRGDTLLIDAAGSENDRSPDPGQRILAPLLRARGIRSIDLAILTHSHPDHARGFGYVARHFPIRELWWNGQGETVPETRQLLAAVRDQGGSIRIAAELPRIVPVGSVSLEVLHPRPGPETEGLPYYPELHENDNSMVVRLSYRGRSVLFTGDIEEEAEALLAPGLAQSDVLKVPHHGSGSSSGAALLGAVRPRLALIAVGDHNRFGFPAPEVLARYAAFGATTLRTDDDGMMTLSTAGGPWRVTTNRGRVLEIR
ncbi:MAG: DNA internalization-related competence protein ComEC/Rec2 [Deltaproteobacteria bacterium]|nr:DNA internalization-related competence protein ComEC/Rec2 [Deltaproteobacteria bacterium]